VGCSARPPGGRHEGIVQPLGHDPERVRGRETRFNRVGVKNYATYQDGIDANAHALMNGRYTNILDALRAGTSATAVAQAIADSPWGTNGGVLRVLQSQHSSSGPRPSLSS
jgi:hypothetical protein